MTAIPDHPCQGIPKAPISLGGHITDSFISEKSKELELASKELDMIYQTATPPQLTGLRTNPAPTDNSEPC